MVTSWLHGHTLAGHGLPHIHLGVIHNGIRDPGFIGQADGSVPFGLVVVLPHMVVQRLSAGADEQRIMFGSDLPAPQRYANISLAAYVRRECQKISSQHILQHNARRFLARKRSTFYNR